MLMVAHDLTAPTSPPVTIAPFTHNATPTPLGRTVLGTLILLPAGPEEERYTIPVPVRDFGLSPFPVPILILPIPILPILPEEPGITSVRITGRIGVCDCVKGDCGCDCDWVRLS